MLKRERRRELFEDVVVRYYQYPEMMKRMERDAAEIGVQMRSLEVLMREDALMASQGVARPEAMARGDGEVSDPVPKVTQTYLLQMQRARTEWLTLRNAQMVIEREMSALEREHVILDEGMAKLNNWVRGYLEKRYRYPMCDFQQIAISADPEVHESTVRHHIFRALATLREHYRQFAPATLESGEPLYSRYARVESLFF